MQTKHILFISSWYPNRKNPTHGIFNRYFAEAVSLYNKVSVLHVCSDENMANELEIHQTEEDNIYSVRVYYKKVKSSIPLLSKLQKRQRILNAFDRGFHEILHKGGVPDLIHLNVMLPSGIGALHLSKKYHIPYVINENWSGYTKEDGNYRGLLVKFLTRRIVKGAKVIMPTSDYLKNAMLSHGLAGNYRVVPNPVNIHRFTLSENKGDGITYFLHISSLNDREKNVSGIIRAFSEALVHQPGILLHIVGTGIDEPLYRRLVDRLKLKNKIIFTGRLMSDLLVKQIQACDALLMFSNYETFGLVNIEAFACGKPVITSNAGAIPSYMQPHLGIMVDKGNESQLTRAIVSFAAQKQEFNAEKIRQYAVQNFSYEKVGKDLDEIYDLALNRR
jgi:glycosyltransferase involved in cell wall biosynthesis